MKSVVVIIVALIIIVFSSCSMSDEKLQRLESTLSTVQTYMAKVDTAITATQEAIKTAKDPDVRETLTTAGDGLKATKEHLEGIRKEIEDQKRPTIDWWMILNGALGVLGAFAGINMGKPMLSIGAKVLTNLATRKAEKKDE